MTYPPNDPPFPDGRFPPIPQGTGQIPFSAQPQVVPIPGHHLLTNDQFENLKRSMQLLRISQLRYIVQKYSLPANGNKTRLLRTVLQLVDAMRSAPLLCQVNNDVSMLIASQHEPFSNPLASMHKLSHIKPDSVKDINFIPPDHPFIFYADVPPLCGPLYALPGSSSGHFQFPIAGDFAKGRVLLNFAWQSNEPLPFEMTLEINGFPLSINIDDPNPSPLDLTDLVKGREFVVADFKCVKTQTTMCLSFRYYEYLSISTIAAHIVHTNAIDHNGAVYYVRGPNCEHQECFSLLHFLVDSFISRKTVCPICQKHFSVFEMKYVPGYINNTTMTNSNNTNINNANSINTINNNNNNNINNNNNVLKPTDDGWDRYTKPL